METKVPLGSPQKLLLRRLCMQSQIQDFPKEGAPFRVKCHVDAIQWGGGVVAEIFRALQKPMRFGGGGVVARRIGLSVTSKQNFSLMLCLLSRIGGRGKASKCTCCLEWIYFTTFDFLHGAYLTAVTEPHACVQRKTLLVLRSQTRHMHSVFWVF